MSKKHKHKGGPAGDPRGRIDRAIVEGRFQLALDLTRHLYKDEPTPAHRELVKKLKVARRVGPRKTQPAAAASGAATSSTVPPSTTPDPAKDKAA